MHDLEDLLGRDGPLARKIGGFAPREQQQTLAAAVAQALDGMQTLVAEAGTGTGKTFAYLVPALLSGRRVLISTGTRTLQDQLFSKDLPLVAAALGRPARIALMKGRSNYLCRYRLAKADVEMQQLMFAAPATKDNMLARIHSWARPTRLGDLSEVRGLSDAHHIWPQVTSTRENCLGKI